MSYEFEHTISSGEELRSIIGNPIDAVANKPLDHIDELFEKFIAASPFVVIGSYGAEGNLDLSPKGDPAGFIKLLDKNTLVFPERPGNRRADTLLNLLDNPSIGLIFLIPGMPDTLRVSGQAKIVRDSKLQSDMAINGREPSLLIVVQVENAFMHCAKCMIRSKLWQPEHWPPLDEVPRLADAAIKQLHLDREREHLVRDAVTLDETENLY